MSAPLHRAVLFSAVKRQNIGGCMLGTCTVTYYPGCPCQTEGGETVIFSHMVGSRDHDEKLKNRNGG